MLKRNASFTAAWLCFVALTFRQVLGQTPEMRDQLIPVIAAVTSGGPEQSVLIRSWRSFRAHWPQRPFCLLRLEGASELFIPAAFSQDSNTIIAVITRDGNESFRRSDWYNACNLDAARVRSVALLLDIEMFAIQSSFEWFLHRLMFASNTPFDAPLLVDPRGNGNWIDPLDVQLLASSMPSSSPTGTPSVGPTPAPSATPSEAPTPVASAAPSGIPSASPSKIPTTVPSRSPSACPSVSPSNVPSVFPSAGPSTILGGGTVFNVSVAFTLTMMFPTTNTIITNGMSTTEQMQFDSALETYFNANLGSVLSGSQFIGTSASNAFERETIDTSTGTTVYSSVVYAVFRTSITSSQFATAANMLSAVPLVFQIFNIGGNFAEVLSTSFAQSYSGMITPSPSAIPSAAPSVSSIPSAGPSGSPSLLPSFVPSFAPSSLPSKSPSDTPSLSPSESPSGGPSGSPSLTPSSRPSDIPSSSPSVTPSGSPSKSPSAASAGGRAAASPTTEDAPYEMFTEDYDSILMAREHLNSTAPSFAPTAD